MEENILESFVNDILQGRNIRGDSEKWANWMSELMLTTCQPCVEGHGTITSITILNGQLDKKVNKHKNCKCLWVPARAKKAGTATNLGKEGADFVFLFTGALPNYYITKDEAKSKGWKSKKGNLSEACPNKMIGGDFYKNKEGKLPQAPNRTWHEADINYEAGKRNRQRILYSNDGLIFATYDHYQTFYEIKL